MPESTRYCRWCQQHRSARRFQRSAAGVYRPKCNTCRNRQTADKQLDQAHQRSRAAATALGRALAHRNAPEALLALVERYCAQADTTVDRLVTELADYARSNRCSDDQRRKILALLLHLQTQAELAQAQQAAPPVEPLDYCRELASTGQYAAITRQLITEGLITLDQIDPPPAGE